SGIVMLVKNKGRDIAILRTIGASPSSILRVFFMAGATIGVAGTLAGLTIGLLFCLNIGSIQPFLEALLGVQLFNADVYMRDAIPAVVGGVGVFSVPVWPLTRSCAASVPPAWSAPRIAPVEALRYQQPGPPPSRHRPHLHQRAGRPDGAEARRCRCERRRD